MQVFALRLVSGPVPDTQDFHSLLLCLETVKDAIIQAEDFAGTPLSVPGKRSTDLREAFEKPNMIKQRLAHFDSCLRVILSNVNSDLVQVAYCGF